LETLADDRNTVAHGEQMPGTMGRLRTKEDILTSLDRLEQTAENIYLTALKFVS